MSIIEEYVTRAEKCDRLAAECVAEANRAILQYAAMLSNQIRYFSFISRRTFDATANSQMLRSTRQRWVQNTELFGLGPIPMVIEAIIGS